MCAKKNSPEILNGVIANAAFEEKRPLTENFFRVYFFPSQSPVGVLFQDVFFSSYRIIRVCVFPYPFLFGFGFLHIPFGKFVFWPLLARIYLSSVVRVFPEADTFNTSTFRTYVCESFSRAHNLKDVVD